uniref:Uncharacterized protein n=1 Tax=Anguilla anguilla TaxID=7936 RepID=A0A0E9R3F7_ANGAN
MCVRIRSYRESRGYERLCAFKNAHM